MKKGVKVLGLIVILVVVGSGFAVMASAAITSGSDIKSLSTKNNQTTPIIVKFTFPVPEITKVGDYDSISMKGLYSYGDPGMPVLPFKTVKILIPQGEHVQDIDIVTGNKVVLKGFFNIECGQTPVPISFNPSPDRLVYSDNKTVETMPNQSVYASTKPFPGKLYSQVSIQELRGYKILILNLYPVQYTPKIGEISYFEEMKVIVTTTPISILPTAKTTFRGLLQDQARVLDVIDNPAEVDTYSTGTKTTGAQPTSIVDPTDSYDYVIITDGTLESAFQPLIDWKKTRPINPINATIVLVENITSDSDYWCDGAWGDGCGNGTQFNDTQAMIRNFIKDAYTNWGIEYVVLGGDDEIIPVRYLFDFFYSSYPDYYSYIPSDSYYIGLDGNWDKDGDGVWGETVSYGANGDEADLYAEVFVGRVTVETPTEANNWVNKVISYENVTLNNATYLSKALMVGEHLWDDPLTWGGDSKDLVANLLTSYAVKTLYDRDSTFSDINVKNELNYGTHIINHNGHASYSGVMGLSRSEVDALTNTDYFFVYSEGCLSAGFDNQMSGGFFGNEESVGEHFILDLNGAFAYIGNTRFGWFCPGSTNGPGDR